MRDIKKKKRFTNIEGTREKHIKVNEDENGWTSNKRHGFIITTKQIMVMKGGKGGVTSKIFVLYIRTT